MKLAAEWLVVEWLLAESGVVEKAALGENPERVSASAEPPHAV